MLITNARLITWGEHNQILDGQAVLIRSGKIIEIGPSAELMKAYPDEEWLDAGGQYVMPGNINAHGHYYSAFAVGISVPGEADWRWGCLEVGGTQHIPRYRKPPLAWVCRPRGQVDTPSSGIAGTIPRTPGAT